MDNVKKVTTTATLRKEATKKLVRLHESLEGLVNNSEIGGALDGIINTGAFDYLSTTKRGQFIVNE